MGSKTAILEQSTKTGCFALQGCGAQAGVVQSYQPSSNQLPTGLPPD
ncbi:hypothetical protein ON05_029950 [Acaryochloris sp. CCMEE 5410]|nr:hypothetical protein ON05_029950 [Acaryochloris sp. CCMEE 5410]